PVVGIIIRPPGRSSGRRPARRRPRLAGRDVRGWRAGAAGHGCGAPARQVVPHSGPAPLRQLTYDLADRVVIRLTAAGIVVAGPKASGHYGIWRSHSSWRCVDETKHGRVLKFASLDEAVVALSKEGFEIVFKDAVACQMRQAKRANGLAVVGLAILTGGLSLIPDVLQRGGKKDNMILLRLDAKGRVRLVKTKKRYVPPLESGSDRLPSPPGSSSTDQTT